MTRGSDITLVEAYWCAEVLSLPPVDVSPIQCLTPQSSFSGAGGPLALLLADKEEKTIEVPSGLLRK